MSPAPNLPGLNALPWRRWQPVGVALLLVVLLHALVLTWLPIGVGAGFDGGVRAWMQTRQIVLPPPQVSAAPVVAPANPPAAAAVSMAPVAPPAEPAPEAATPPTPELVLAETPPAPDAAASAVASSDAAPPASAESGGQTVPTFATRMPPAVVMRFELRRGGLTGDAELVWQPRAEGYALTLNANAFGLSVLSWSSQGAFDLNGLAPERFVDRRRSRDVRAANFQREKGLITFSGPPIQYPLVPGAQDRLSWMVQLPAIIAAAPAAFPPGARIPLFVAGARGDADLWFFTAEGIETVDIVGGQVENALRLLREPRRPYDTRVEVWLDPARHHLPVRVRLSMPMVGDSNEFMLKEMAGLPPTKP